MALNMLDFADDFDGKFHQSFRFGFGFGLLLLPAAAVIR